MRIYNHALEEAKMAQSALIIGASRGLGLAIVAEFLKRGWNVVATERSPSRSELKDYRIRLPSQLQIETVDINSADSVNALRSALGTRKFDFLLVNAGVALGAQDKLEAVSSEEFIRIMTTNALSPIAAISKLKTCVSEKGTLAAMSSSLGSVALNEHGTWEVYRASKAALNTLMRSFVARDKADQKTYLLLDPGWVRTDMGGSEADLSVEESIPRLIDVALSQSHLGGLHYLNYKGEILPW